MQARALVSKSKRLHAFPRGDAGLAVLALQMVVAVQQGAVFGPLLLHFLGGVQVRVQGDGVVSAGYALAGVEGLFQGVDAVRRLNKACLGERFSRCRGQQAGQAAEEGILPGQGQGVGPGIDRALAASDTVGQGADPLREDNGLHRVVHVRMHGVRCLELGVEVWVVFAVGPAAAAQMIGSARRGGVGQGEEPGRVGAAAEALDVVAVPHGFGSEDLGHGEETLGQDIAKPLAQGREMDQFNLVRDIFP